MAQIRNRFEIQDSLIEDTILTKRKLPNFFDTKDDISPLSGISMSIAFHFLGTILFIFLAAIYGLVMPHFPKPDMPVRDIEFKLVQSEEKPPINKKTKIRSDRNSQAGGKHNKKLPVSQPSTPSSKPTKKVASQPKAQPNKVQKPQQKQNIFNQAKQLVKQQPQKQPTPKQPQVAKAPVPTKPTVAKPQAPSALKPTNATPKPTGAAKPQAPKIATAPKSPFTVPVPQSKAPVGSTYRPQGTSGSGSRSGVAGGTGSAPAPKFSTSGGSGSGSGSSSASSGNRYASRGSGGSGGSGSIGNPSPGNPNGAPGIDAIKQPNWGPYMRDLEQRIKRNWTPPKGDSSKRVVITFTIARDGRLLSHRVTKSSGVPLADRAAMSAIELTAPFRPLPPEFKGQSVPIEFTFDYNVLNSVLR